jgi:uncharacterized sulfatase
MPRHNPIKRREFIRRAGAAAAAAPVLGRAIARAEAAGQAASARADARPNILFVLGDDWGWPSAGALGDKVVRTPTFDRVAREGVLFPQAYCASPSCSPSRASILTGQMFWRLGEGANLWSTLPKKFDVYTDQLEAAGYRVGAMRKGWGPGSVEAGGRTQNAAGPAYKTFEAFLKSVPEGRPFCFWFGSHDPHRPYDPLSGAKSGLRAEDVRVPPSLPDAPEVRNDILDYYFECERCDREAGEMLTLLEAAGKLENTLVVMTGDNGMPFPRAKTNLYDSGARQPLAVRWGARVKGGRTVDDFVSLEDLAPTFLEAAGLRPGPDMTARSFLDVLLADKAGRVDPRRDRVVTGRERHHGGARPGCLGYPARALRTYDCLYIRNFLPDRWPAGDPPGYEDCDAGPTKAYMLAHRDDAKVAPLFELAFGMRPGEELYDLKKDPDQLKNVAADPACADAKKRMAGDLAKILTGMKDPRVIGGGEEFDKYPYRGPAADMRKAERK